jgi:hypothetical protein
MYVLKTRSRVQRTLEFIENYKKTNGTAKIYVRLDNDDPDLNQYQQVDWPESFTIHIDNRCMLGEAMQEMFLKYPNEFAYGIVADDFIPITKNWDTLAINATEGIKICCWNEYLVSKSIAPKKFEHMVVGGNLTRHIGWFGLPCTKHYFQDIVWRYISYEIKNILVFLNDVKVIHDHPKSNDYLYKKSLAVLDQDTENFNKWMKTDFNELLQKVKIFASNHDI